MNKLSSILLIDDDQINNFIVVSKLKSIALVENIHCVENGNEALIFIKNCIANDQQNIPQLVFLDINMPVMDGMDCARAVRALADAKKAKIPMIAITGNARNYTMDDFKAAGFDDFLAKPLNFDALVNQVKALTE